MWVGGWVGVLCGSGKELWPALPPGTQHQPEGVCGGAGREWGVSCAPG